jgi:adenylate cyclase
LDDAETLERLRAVRRTVIDPAIAEHGGRIVQTGGDSLLMVFDSIDGAVQLRYSSRFRTMMRVIPPTRRSAFASGSISATRLRRERICMATA